MLVRHYSDIHNEFMLRGIDPEEWEDYCYKIPVLKNDINTVLILNGDIDSKPKRLGWYLDSLASRFRHVIMICGNHELYHGVPADIVHKKILAEVKSTNVTVVGNTPEKLQIDNVVFIAGTGWTHVPDVENRIFAEYIMNDYKYGKIEDYRRLRADDVFYFNVEMGCFVDKEMENPDPSLTYVLLTHHVPHDKISEFAVSGFEEYKVLYYNCSGLINENTHKFDHVFFGHIHDNGANLKKIGKTVCHVNCVGYPMQEKTEVHEAITI